MFIKLTDAGVRILVNFDRVETIEPMKLGKKGSMLTFNSNMDGNMCRAVEESIVEIQKLIEVTQSSTISK
jgi:hypothetical protein